MRRRNFIAGLGGAAALSVHWSMLASAQSRPGGNATGFVQFEYSLSGKWPELLKQIAPGVTRVAVLRDPSISAGIGQFAVIQSVAPSLGVESAQLTCMTRPKSSAPSWHSHAPQTAA
jgi:hypothetical protein